MPLIFIHGVNTRDTDPDYASNVVARSELVQRLILDPLAGRGKRFKRMEVVNVYWGNHGVDFRWKLQSLPDVRALEDLGGGDGATPQSDLEFTETVQALGGKRPRGTARLESLGADEGLLKRAAQKDLRRFTEAILMPVLLAEIDVWGTTAPDPNRRGLLEAQLAIAAEEVASDPQVQAAVAAAPSDEEVMQLLKAQVLARFEQLVQQRLGAAPAGGAPGGELETLGPAWLEEIKDRVGELFDRAVDAPGRAATLPALALFREGIHRNLSRFVGDVFVYLNERGDRAAPGPIVTTVLDAINAAPKHHPAEPLIIITHSMGGNILYDILTYYAPDLKIDFWASVAGQVAQFEEMKLFKASDRDIRAPAKVGGLRPRVGYWLNVYDPADSFSFMTAPVFADANDDVRYLTGASALKAHSEYFGRASFYTMVREHIEKALL